MALLYAILGVFALLAVLSLLGALYILLAELIGPVQAACVFALVWFILALVAWAAIVAARRPPRKPADDRLQRDIASIAGVAAVSNLPLIFGVARKRKGLLAIPVLGVIGFAGWRAYMTYRARR